MAYTSELADSVVLSDQPLSLLSPDLAKVVEVSRYVWTGTTAVFVWDVLNNLKADYLLLSRYRIGWPVLAYFISRIFCLIYVLGFTIFLTYPVGGCGTLDRVLDSLYPVAVPATSLLFFFRVRAIYGGERSVTVIFGLLWMVEFGACMVVPFGTGGVNIGPTAYCLVAILAPYAGAAGITPAIFDTAVFLAISYRLIGNTHVDYSRMEKFRAFLSGAYLPSFSRSLLVDGQVYYMIVVISNVATCALIWAPGINTGYRAVLAIPNITITSVMACRVYRNTRLRLAQEPDIIVPSSNMGGNINGTLPLRFVSPAGQAESDVVNVVLSLEKKHDIPVGSIYG
ncbi:hypothetical protein C8R44DRAFT_778543 [Mycena epipterygia]|nr:hypothetical protein C8R44DRAFT_778543 [Mycena epipterygia]